MIALTFYDSIYIDWKSHFTSKNDRNSLVHEVALEDRIAHSENILDIYRSKRTYNFIVVIVEWQSRLV